MGLGRGHLNVPLTRSRCNPNRITGVTLSQLMCWSEADRLWEEEEEEDNDKHNLLNIKTLVIHVDALA